MLQKGESGGYRNGCAVLPRPTGKATIPSDRKRHLDQGAVLSRSGAPVHRTTTHNDAKGYLQGALCSQTNSTHTAAAVGDQTRPDDAKNNPLINFADDVDKGFTV